MKERKKNDEQIVGLNNNVKIMMFRFNEWNMKKFLVNRLILMKSLSLRND